MYSEFINRNQGLPVYKELQNLAERANIVVILELLKKLRRAQGNLKQQDRLYQALMAMATYSPWKQPLGTAALYREVKDPKAQSQAESLLRELSEVIKDLPLAWGKDRRNYACLQELESNLFRSPSRQKVTQDSWLAWASAHHYFLIYKHLLTAQYMMGSPGRPKEWLDFLVTSPFLEVNLDAYSKARKDLAPLKLPPIPCIRIDKDLWLFSEELVSGTLRTHFNMTNQERKANLSLVH